MADSPGPTDLPACALCATPSRAWFEKQGRLVCRCARCGLIHVREGLACVGPGVSIYEAKDGCVFLEDGNEAYYMDENNVRSLRAKVDWLLRFVPRGGAVLDAGAGFGDFLKACEGVFTAEGFDVSPVAVERSLRLGVANRVGSVYALPEGLKAPFDAITLWDVIEHLPDPARGLQGVRGLLKPDGWLFLSTPDAGSCLARLLGQRWHYIDPVQHLFLFNRRNVEELLRRAGFQVVQARAFGRYYRLRYIFDRLEYLHRGALARAALRAGRSLLHFFLECSIHLKLGDVMGVAARRVP